MAASPNCTAMVPKHAISLTLTTSRALEVAGEAQLTGIYNVGTEESYSFNTLVDMLNEELGTDIEPTYVENPIPSQCTCMIRMPTLRSSMQKPGGSHRFRLLRDSRRCVLRISRHHST